jgi:hypothetical protein
VIETATRKMTAGKMPATTIESRCCAGHGNGHRQRRANPNTLHDTLLLAPKKTMTTTRLGQIVNRGE